MKKRIRVLELTQNLRVDLDAADDPRQNRELFSKSMLSLGPLAQRIALPFEQGCEAAAMPLFRDFVYGDLCRYHQAFCDAIHEEDYTAIDTALQQLIVYVGQRAILSPRNATVDDLNACLLYTSPSPRDPE